jgi:hypothetical protein
VLCWRCPRPQASLGSVETGWSTLENFGNMSLTSGEWAVHHQVILHVRWGSG